ncbi:MAG: helix-turn-helix domain-containing protein [Candidatus Dependentiae bacterium]
MIAAAIESDEVSMHKLARAAGLSPTIVQSVKSGTRKNVSAQSLFKILRGLGCAKLS